MSKAQPPLDPPHWPRKFLRFLIRKEYLEEIEGDMEEVFNEHVQTHSLRRARFLYLWDTLRLIRPGLMKHIGALNPLNRHAMYKNYLKISMRGLLRNPVNSFINIFGLAAAIGICVFGYAFFKWTTSTDQFHVNKERVHLVTFFANRDGVEQEYGRAPLPMGEMLRHDFAHISKVCRVDDRRVIMKHDDRVFHERVRFADPEFLEMFTFPLKWGTASSLRDLNNIVLSEDMSVKYFGEDNPVGRQIIMITGQYQQKVFRVGGVAAAFPKSRTISFSLLVNFENLRQAFPEYAEDDWTAFVNATFVQIEDPSAIPALREGFEKYRKLQNAAAEPDWAITGFGLEPLATLHRRSEYIRDDISRSSQDNYTSIVFIAVLGGFLLTLACFNYINIAIASAAKRLREIGVRKSIGATRGVVVRQFLTENLVITSFALAVGVALGMTIFIPGFEKLWHFSMDFTLADGALWLFLIAVLLLTSLASGIYPSLYISRFQVVGILKGSVKFGQRNPVTKILLGFQVIQALVFIITAVMFTQNTGYLIKRPWGYAQDHLIYAAVPDGAGAENLAAAISAHPDVLEISASAHHLGKSNRVAVLRFPEREVETDELAVDPNYFQTMGLTIQQGRSFVAHEGSDRNAVVINETLAKNMAWSQPVGKTFRIDSVEHEVIGVVKDFHHFSFSSEVRPIIFRASNKQDHRYLSIRAREGSSEKVYAELQQTWSEIFPEVPFEGGYQEDVWGFYYQSIRIYGLVWRVFAFIAIALALLGLYGLVRLNVTGRMKEFSIRKVLGAGWRNIAQNIFSHYTLLVVIAFVVGVPLGFVVGKSIIEMAYVYHMPITSGGAIIGAGLFFTLTMVTLSTQIRKVVKANTVDGLKTD